MSRFPTWLQAGAVGLAILLIGAAGVVAMNGQLRLNSSQSTWRLTVLHTNDVRSSVEPCTWHGVGGLARRATAIKIERQAGDHVLLLDAGNSILGFRSAHESKASMMFAAMNRMGYDALTIGQGELRTGSEALLSLMAQAGFPFLSANLTRGKGGPPLVQPYTIRQLDGHRVAIIGVTAPEATDIYQLEEGEVGVLDPIESVRRQVGVVKDQAEVIIVLSYLGLEADQELARQVKGIDLIVGGRSGENLEEPLRDEVTGTVIVQAGSRGQQLGIIDLELDQRGRIESYEGRNLELNEGIAGDEEFRTWLRSVQPTPTPESERKI